MSDTKLYCEHCGVVFMGSYCYTPAKGEDGQQLFQCPLGHLTVWREA